MKRNSLITAATAILLVIFFENCKKDFETTVNTGIEKNDALARTKPNIIFIVGDDIGYEIPTIDGGKSYSTPNIDKLAQDGMRFTQCRSAALCSPSRFMLLTGKYNFRNYTKWGEMNSKEKTFATLLRKGGYTTYAAGKWQFIERRPYIAIYTAYALMVITATLIP